jgi:hypothetical protein
VDHQALNHKIMKATLDRAAIMVAAGALGLKGPNNVLVFDTEDESSILMDCAFYEYRARGKNAVERYQEEIGGKTEIERELLAAMVISSTSLFRVESVSARTCSLILSDLVNADRAVTLMDINFSQYVKPNHLLFIRPITLASFSMTSGVAFVFPGHLESKLLEPWREPQVRGSLHKGQRAQPTSIVRYGTFFKLSKRLGVEVSFRSVDAK